MLAIGGGGGWDIISGLGVALALIDSGHEVVLANLTFTLLEGIERATRLSPNLYSVDEQCSSVLPYAPELILSRWFAAVGDPRPLYLFRKTGVQPMREALQLLIEREKPDLLLLLDGGIDALLRGDEASLGTPTEDWISLAAVHSCSGPPDRILACIGFGAERWDGISHAQAMRRISELMASGGYLGCESLVRDTPPGQRWLDCLRYFEGQQGSLQGIVTATIRASMQGDFGLMPVNPRTAQTPIFVSPIASLAWFFELGAVVKSKLYIDAIEHTNTVMEVVMAIEENRPAPAPRESMDFDQCSP
ncbi:DUF1152 domain-containing protein [soil metagenome]